MLAGVAWLAGCATVPATESEHPLPALEAYARNAFIPINLYVNANEHASGRRAELLEYAAAKIENSGAFLRADRGTQRWLYSLQLRFREQDERSGAGYVLRALSVLTLGLAPVRLAQTQQLTVEVFLEPEPVGKFSYSDTFGNWVSLYSLADSNKDERAAVDRLLERMMAEFAATKIVPRAKEFDQPPVQKKKDKAKGQPT